MPFAPHYRVTLVGDIQAVNGPVIEQFSIGINLSKPFGIPGSGAGRFDQGGADDVTADALAFWARAETGMSQAARLRTVKLASIGADGKYADDPFISEVDQRAGGTQFMPYPPQVSLAVSLVTDRRGPTGKGRFYLPCPSLGLDGNGLLGAAARDACAASCQQFLNDLNNWPGPDASDPRVIVASTKGYNSNVTGVRVGRAYDTVRSRREKLGEAYNEPLPVG